MTTCKVHDCQRTVSKKDHDFCLDHWKSHRAGRLKQCPSCQTWHETTATCPACAPHQQESTVSIEDDDSPPGLLSSTRIARHFSLSGPRINLILAELGWIEKYANGWSPTDRGNALGANVKSGNKAPYILWPESILKNPALLSSIAEQTGRTFISATTDHTKPRDPSADFRAKFPANYRATDGHLVRSRAELLIDNWLYMQNIPHAYERRLPIDEECYCDFYLPGGKGVYIEYWGREWDTKYRERQAVKLAIYQKHNLRLIELGDEEIARLDDVLPRALLRFGIESS